MGTKILLIDHNDSFTYNLVQLLEEAGAQSVTVMPYDKPVPALINSVDAIVLSPGPGLPVDYKESFALLSENIAVKPILGVCLGLQIIVEFFGGKLYHLNKVKHGRRVNLLKQADSPLFENIDFPFSVGLYHSWAMDGGAKIEGIQITSSLEDGTIMSIQHTAYKIQAVQFHPESYMTKQGIPLIKNWLRLVQESR